jgi:Xaa-Pro aminopeptidase
VKPGPTALAGSWPAGALVAACARLTAEGWSFVDGNEALRRVRRRKQADELGEIRRVTAAVGEAFAAVAKLLGGATPGRDGELHLQGEPLTIGRLKQAIARVFAEHELAQPRGNIVSPGEEGGVPHTAGTPTRVVRAGESLVVDLYPRGRLFSDATRTFCVGPVPATLARAHADVAAALALAHAGTRPGARGWDLQEAVCRLLAERGWPTPVTAPGTLRGYVHNLGHGVGQELHEYPSFRREAQAAPEGELAAGDVVTLEPGLYEPAAGGFGVRLEDLVVLDENGAENLTAWPYDLDPRAWARR